ncbi:hypothetical protein NQ314_021106 [Rhamnusium bicolor]|uniref:Uncharacterized protein n=1 Tax=Rhamnusium bicolor TaxID=1586634 RepID=A0AAV8WIT9_9CUCU|nr:hypothetical protein NQ314_021106 [Rhamnusium bicolor]
MNHTEDYEIATHPQTSQISAASTSSTPQNRNKRRKPSEKAENSKVEESLGILKTIVENNALKTDECSVYGQHVANKLRNHAKKTRDIVQHDFNFILFNADMGQYNIMETGHSSTSNSNFSVSSLQ